MRLLHVALRRQACHLRRLCLHGLLQPLLILNVLCQLCLQVLHHLRRRPSLHLASKPITDKEHSKDCHKGKDYVYFHIS